MAPSPFLRQPPPKAGDDHRDDDADRNEVSGLVHHAGVLLVRAVPPPIGQQQHGEGPPFVLQYGVQSHQDHAHESDGGEEEEEARGRGCPPSVLYVESVALHMHETLPEAAARSMRRLYSQEESTVVGRWCLLAGLPPITEFHVDAAGRPHAYHFFLGTVMEQGPAREEEEEEQSGSDDASASTRDA